MTDTASLVLSELELDALTELVNLGVSNAALGLREMVREEIVLTVPLVRIVSREVAVADLSEREAKRLVGVHQDFEGDINGRALVIFPELKSIELVRAVVGRDLSLDEIFELEQEALAETGNILLNGCLSTIANMLGRTLKISLPEVIYGEAVDFFAASPTSMDDSILFIYINFAVRNRDLHGYIAMFLDMPSLATLRQLIDDFIERTTLAGSTNLPVTK